MTFGLGLVIGAIGGALCVLGFILGMILEDRLDILSIVNKHREDR